MTGEEQIVGYEEDKVVETRDDEGKIHREVVKGDPIYETVEAPTTHFGTASDEPFAPIVQFDADRNPIEGEVYAPAVFANDWSRNAGGKQGNISRNARNQIATTILDNVGNLDAGESLATGFLDRYLDILSKDRLPVFSREATNIYKLHSKKNISPTRTKEGKYRAEEARQRGTALKFAQDLMNKLYSEKGVDVGNRRWDKFMKINRSFDETGTLTDNLKDNKETVIRNIIDNHAISTHENIGAVKWNLADQLMKFTSDEGVDSGGDKVHWHDSKHENFKDWANEWLDTKHEELKGGYQTPTMTHKPDTDSPLPPNMNLERSDIGDNEFDPTHNPNPDAPATYTLPYNQGTPESTFPQPKEGE